MTMKYRTPATRDVALQGPDDLGQFIRSLGPDSFKAAPYRRRAVGPFGELAGGPDPAVRYRLPEWFSAEALQKLPLEQLDSYKAQLKQQRKSYEQQRGTGPQYEDDQYMVLPQNIDPGSMAGREELLRLGYRAVEGNSDDNGSTTFWLAPGAHQENYDAAQAFRSEGRAQMALFDELGAAIQRARDVRSQNQARAQNQLFGGIAELGYDFAPGSLGDAGVRQEVWDARDYLPQFLRNVAASRNFLRKSGDTGRFAGELVSYTPEELLDMGIGLSEGTDQGVLGGTTIFDPGGGVRRPTATQSAQPMPYNPADPLSEAAYYGGPQYRGPDSIARYQMPEGVGTRDMFPDYTPMKPVFDDGPTRSFQPVSALRPLAGGMELRPGVRVRNPFEESVRRLGPRPSRGMSYS